MAASSSCPKNRTTVRNPAPIPSPCASRFPERSPVSPSKNVRTLASIASPTNRHTFHQHDSPDDENKTTPNERPSSKRTTLTTALMMRTKPPRTNDPHRNEHNPRDSPDDANKTTPNKTTPNERPSSKRTQPSRQPSRTTPHRTTLVPAPTNPNTKKEKDLHRPGIEPGSVPWQGTILPLDHRCL